MMIKDYKSVFMGQQPIDIGGLPMKFEFHNGPPTYLHHNYAPRSDEPNTHYR